MTTAQDGRFYAVCHSCRCLPFGLVSCSFRLKEAAENLRQIHLAFNPGHIVDVVTESELETHGAPGTVPVTKEEEKA